MLPALSVTLRLQDDHFDHDSILSVCMLYPNACTAKSTAGLDSSCCGGLNMAEEACLHHSLVVWVLNMTCSLCLSACNLLLHSFGDELPGDGRGGHLQQECAMLG